MLTFLSDEWIDALDTAGTAGTSDPIGASENTGEASPVITIEQRISDPDDGDITYAVLVYDDAIRVRKGPSPAPDITFVTDRETAAAIAQGQASAQAAFMSGNLRLIGEASALLRSQAALQELADRFATVRDRTRW